MKTVNDIREQFKVLKYNNDISENGTIEIINTSFIADESCIFGTLNEAYAEAELNWYLSESLNVDDIPGKTPKIWKNISSDKNEINSNYGWCIFSDKNKNQFLSAVNCLFKDKYSRQAAMIYNRPSMHVDSKKDNMNDFMCTYSTQLLIRKNKLEYIVYMRSNDAVYGYKNDKHWHDYVHKAAFNMLKTFYNNLEIGQMYWNAASLHVYERHFELI